MSHLFNPPPYLKNSVATTDLCTIILVFPFSIMSYKLYSMQPFQIRFCHSVICIYETSFMYFCGLIANFFLSLNNIPLYRYTTVCLSIHLLKNILVASSFWRSRQSCYKHSDDGFCVGPKFSKEVSIQQLTLSSSLLLEQSLNSVNHALKSSKSLPTNLVHLPKKVLII